MNLLSVDIYSNGEAEDTHHSRFEQFTEHREYLNLYNER